MKEELDIKATAFYEIVTGCSLFVLSSFYSQHVRIFMRMQIFWLEDLVSEDISCNDPVWLTYYGINISKNFHPKSHHHTIEIYLNLRNKTCYTNGFGYNLV